MAILDQRVHPRVSGVLEGKTREEINDLGSSPRERGFELRDCEVIITHGFIPA